VQMNILAATAPAEAKDEVYNVAVGDRTTLNELFTAIKTALTENEIKTELEPAFRDFRAGDVRHSQADVSKAVDLLGYEPTFKILQGIQKAMPWYIQFIGIKK
jgi:UDP-N-acetylglucosamine 4-epimerase